MNEEQLDQKKNDFVAKRYGFKKRTETTIVSDILKWLQCLENSGKITWVDRLQSGRVTSTWKYKRKHGGVKEHYSRIRLCREGTPDIYCILNNGHILWIEVKTEKGKHLTSQMNFELMVKPFDNHTYVLTKSLDLLCQFLKMEYGLS